MKNYYETIKDTKASLAENPVNVPKGTELVHVAHSGASDYAVKDPKALGACPHDSVYRYAYVPKDAVFAARLIRGPLKQKSDNWQETANIWTVTIGGQQFEYYTGSGIKEAPTYDDVLSCLLLDSEALTQSFEEWADELGMNTDSRSAYTAWEACCDNARKLIAARVDIEAEKIRLQDY